MIKTSFKLHDDPRPSVLIAGGIGITPLKAMAQSLITKGREFHLHYAAKSTSDMPYRSKLNLALKQSVSFYASDESERMDIENILSNAAPETVFYVCGPERLIAAVRKAGDQFNIPTDRIKFETFTVVTPLVSDHEITVHLERSNQDIVVTKDQTILDALLDANIETAFACKTGACATCAVKVLEGTADHRDQALSDDDRDKRKLMCTCISRSSTDTLTLDI